MARVIFRGASPGRPNPFGTFGKAFGDAFGTQAVGLTQQRREGEANLALLEEQLRLGGLDPSVPSVAPGQSAPFVLSPEVRDQAERQAGDPRLELIRRLREDPKILADSGRFSALTKMVAPAKRDPLVLSEGARAVDPTTGEELASNPRPVKASSAIGKLYEDFRNGLLDRQEFEESRKNLLDAGKKGAEIRTVKGALVSVDPITNEVNVLYRAPAEADSGRDKKRDSIITDYVDRFGLDLVQATAVYDGQASVIQRPEGTYGVVFKGAEGGRDRVRDDKKADYMRLYPGVTEAEAVALADDKARIETTQTGQVRFVNEITGEVRELQVASSEPIGPVSVPPDQTLYAAAAGGTGLVSALQSFGIQIGGQLGLNPRTEVLAKRTLLTIAQQDFGRTMANNPRFSEGEQQRIRQEMALLPTLVDSTEALRARMEVLDDYLAVIGETARRRSLDPALGGGKRDDARIKYLEVQAFRERLGVQAFRKGRGTAEAAAETKPSTGAGIDMTPEEFMSKPPEERRRLIEEARKGG